MGNPVRVVSLLPSATEIISEVIRAAGPSAGVELVGKSHECDYGPVSLEKLPILTSARTKFTSSRDVDEQVRKSLGAGESLYAVDEKLLAALHPDVILTQSLCEVCSVDYRLIKSLAQSMPPPGPEVVDLSPQNLWEVLDDLGRVGHSVGQPEAAKRAIEALKQRISTIVNLVQEKKNNAANDAARPTVLVAEWTDPIFVGGHWTPQIVHMAGGCHVLNPGREDGGAGKSFTVPFSRLVESDPDWIIVAPCGLDLATTRKEMAPLESHPEWKSLRAVQHGRVVLVDGNQMFNRPGPRLVDALEFVYALLWDSPEHLPNGFPFEYCHT